MSKKETEFDRYDRMKKMERESELQKRKSDDISSDKHVKKGGKPKLTSNSPSRKNWTRDYESLIEEEYEYI